MPKAWVKERKKDLYYRLSKKYGYRSRAAYKLKQIQKKFHILHKGDVVIDLGASPGGWSQVAREYVGPKGKVLAIDIVPMRPIEGVLFLKRDIREERSTEDALELLSEKANVILSDASPKLSGNRWKDHATSAYLARSALDFSGKTLKKGGSLAVKIFQGDEYGTFLREVSRKFGTARGFTPKASDSRSAETYVIGLDKGA